MSGDSSGRVVVIGGGVVGLCCAHEALLRGREVLVLDAASEDFRSCSFGNAGMVVPSHFVPLAAPGMIRYGLRMALRRDSPFGFKLPPSRELIRWGWQFARSASAAHVAQSSALLARLHLQSRKRFVQLDEELGGIGLVQKGLLMVCRTTAALEHEATLIEAGKRYGVEAERVSEMRLRAVDSGMEYAGDGGVHFLQDCHLDPEQLMSRLQERILQLGGQIEYGAKAQVWDRTGGQVEAVRTNRGSVEADQFVLAAGVHSQELAAQLDTWMPLQGGKGYSVTLEDPPKQPDICSILVEARVAVTPIGNRLRLAGTMELAGLDDSINTRRVQGYLRSIQDYIPSLHGVDLSRLPVWAGLRPCSPDGMPYVGRFAKARNVIAATGHAMMGVSLAPITGQLAADLLCSTNLDISVERLSPDRFNRR